MLLLIDKTYTAGIISIELLFTILISIKDVSIIFLCSGYLFKNEILPKQLQAYCLLVERLTIIKNEKKIISNKTAYSIIFKFVKVYNIAMINSKKVSKSAHINCNLYLDLGNFKKVFISKTVECMSRSFILADRKKTKEMILLITIFMTI